MAKFLKKSKILGKAIDFLFFIIYNGKSQGIISRFNY